MIAQRRKIFKACNKPQAGKLAETSHLEIYIEYCGEGERLSTQVYAFLPPLSPRISATQKFCEYFSRVQSEARLAFPENHLSTSIQFQNAASSCPIRQNATLGNPCD